MRRGRSEPPPDDVLGAYVLRMRRLRRRYSIIVGVLVLAVVVAVKIVIATGEVAHAYLHEATGPAATPTASAIPSGLALKWHTSDSLASGQPAWDGTVVTFDAHTVSGRDYLTGAVRWSYTRTDVPICNVVQQQDLSLIHI